MKHLRDITTCILTAAIFYLVFPMTVYASEGQGGHSLTIPQLLILVLVMGWYLYNHFKDKIKAMFAKKK
ncbi:MAG: hypothetical protein GXP53_08410 [Deltaproteobacteria bacterium]|nr:hypothetical protein [Deltaproteobacteria bacterium]